MDIPSLFMIPSAVSSGKVHSVFPNSTDADFDFNRDSSATRVNSQGLIETVGYFGSELVSNGNFTNGSSNWSLTSEGTITTNGANINNLIGGAISFLQQNNVTVIGRKYKLQYYIRENNSGSLKFNTAENANLPIPSTVGVHTLFFTASLTEIIFARLSGSTDIDDISIVEVTGDRARLNYEIEGGLVNTKPSLLLEPQSTNLVTYSEDFSQWDNNGSTDISNSTTSPDGQITADKITKLGTSGNDRVLKIISVSNSTVYNISVFVKNDTNVTGGVTTLAFRVSGGTLFRRGYEWGANGLSFATTQASGTSRVGFSFTTNGTSGNFEIDIDRENTNNTTSIFVWGAMVEQQTHATSYIPTNGSVQTRANETCNGAGTSSILPSEEGILYIETSVIGLTSTLESISISDGTYNNAILFRYYDTSDNQIQYVVRVGSSIVAAINFTLSDALAFNKIALRYKANDFALWANGTQVGTDTSGAIPTGLSDFYGKIRDIRVYNTKEMTDSEIDILLTKITS
jgi:hypothetical protein